MYAQLFQNGQLHERAEKAAQQTDKEYQDGITNGMLPHESWEAVRERHLFLSSCQPKRTFQAWARARTALRIQPIWKRLPYYRSRPDRESGASWEYIEKFDEESAGFGSEMTTIILW
jgi:hypothetical protein